MNSPEKNVCDVCKLFGCNGWEKRFRLEVEAQGDFDRNKGYEENQEFTIKIDFTHNCQKEHKWILWQTFDLISEYGAIGGKTKLKPSDKPKGESYSYYGDFGIIKVNWEKSSFELPDISKEEVKENLQNPPEQDFTSKSTKLPNLKFFIFSKNENLNSSDYYKLKEFKDFYKGNRGGKSNKFATYKNKDRFWGYTEQKEEIYIDTKEKLNELGITQEKMTEGSSILEDMGGD
ncbi:MAG: CRISPR-Cas system related protein, RAMP superfamily Cas7 group, incomplete [Candidatus Methanohalarchaeum thermophilum]|uniref:CRISPR-Cas system related protein, RAMP superfamily Cas7 group, incomplete n=1 Tax=Methanohalarchaeum thermophilum TaxID=1903181 RepID=A0A1Q6DVC1_METT1|nr:MAG: CRISPR-Cas system related protein, RAMP superfamily Cas7 group, incomplete [Candidatus Methanohalarchaeum thermophilum]